MREGSEMCLGIFCSRDARGPPLELNSSSSIKVVQQLKSADMKMLDI